MHVASLSPLSVGGLAWSSPDPCYTVVLKATFSLETDGPLNLHLQQSPVCDEQAGPIEGELVYGSDFAPRKVGVDVVVVGHARSREAATDLPFRLELGELRTELHAVSDRPKRAISLSAQHVRRRPDDARSSVQLAPRPTATRSWRNHLIASHFDFTAFNSAAPEQRLDEMPLDAVLRLEGLLVSSADREVLIGDTQPYVFYVRDCRARDDADLLFPACDTVFIDTDRERLILTWRCEARPGSPGENPFLAVVLGTRRVPPDWADVKRRLTHARWHEAVEPLPGPRVPPSAWGSFSLPAAPSSHAHALPPPAPSSHAQARRTGDEWPVFDEGRDGPPTPKTAWVRERSGRKTLALDEEDGPLTPRSPEGPPTPRSLDDDEEGPSTPRTYAAIDRTTPLDDIELIDSVDRTAPLGSIETTERVAEGELDFGGEATEKLAEEAGPRSRRNLEAAELEGYLEDEQPTRARRPTEPCPPPDEERAPSSESSPG